MYKRQKEDSAIKRDARQQEILVSLSDKLKNLSASELPGLMNTLLPYVKTNLNVSEILNISTLSLIHILSLHFFSLLLPSCNIFP